MLPFLVTLFHRTLFCSQIIDILDLLPSLNLNLSPDRDLPCQRCTNQGADHRRHDRCWAGSPFFSFLSFFSFPFFSTSCSGWCTIIFLRRQILASLEEELCGVSPLSSSPCPSSFSGSTTTRSSLNTSWSISPIITESSGGSDGVFSRSNLLQWIEGPSSPARFFLSVTIFYGS